MLAGARYVMTVVTCTVEVTSVWAASAPAGGGEAAPAGPAARGDRSGTFAAGSQPGAVFLHAAYKSCSTRRHVGESMCAKFEAGRHRSPFLAIVLAHFGAR